MIRNLTSLVVAFVDAGAPPLRPPVVQGPGLRAGVILPLLLAAGLIPLLAVDVMTHARLLGAHATHHHLPGGDVTLRLHLGELHPHVRTTPLLPVLGIQEGAWNLLPLGRAMLMTDVVSPLLAETLQTGAVTLLPIEPMATDAVMGGTCLLIVCGTVARLLRGANIRPLGLRRRRRARSMVVGDLGLGPGLLRCTEEKM